MSSGRYGLWRDEVPEDETAGWTIDGFYASSGAVTRPADYVPFQSIFEPDGRHAYDPSQLSYPRTIRTERTLGLPVNNRRARREQWESIRPGGLHQDATIELGVRDDPIMRSSARNTGESDWERMLRHRDNNDPEYERILDDVRASREGNRRYQDDRYSGFMRGGSRTAGRGDYDQMINSGRDGYRRILPAGFRSDGDFMQGGLRSTAGANPALYADDYGRGSGRGGRRGDLYEQYFGDDYDGYEDGWPRSRGPY